MISRYTLFLALGVAIWPLVRAPAFAQSAPAPAQDGRVVVIGMDGMDAEMTRRWMEEGKLPNFARLQAQGTFAPLMPGNPAQSPVSWATLNTGRNPGKHGIFDFVRNKREKTESGDPRLDYMPVPDVGFQKVVRVPVAEAGLPMASGTTRLMVLGGALLVGVVLFFLLRQVSILLAAGLGLLAALGGGWAYLDMGKAFPAEGFKDYESLNGAQEWWFDLDRHGVPFRGQGTIVDYPVQPLEHGVVVAGLGAPDATASLNAWAIYSTLEQRQRDGKTYQPLPAYSYGENVPPSTPVGDAEGSGILYRLVQKEDGVYTSKVYGPLNQVLYDKLKKELEAATKDSSAGQRAQELRSLLRNTRLLSTWLPLEVRWRKGDAAVQITTGGTSQTVSLNSWSEFFELTFSWSRWLKTRALARFWVEPDGDGLEMYLAPLQIHPEEPTPGSRICWPRDFAGEVAQRIGFFETLGWACQTHAVKDAALSDAAFLSDIEFTEEWRRRMLEDAFQDSSWKVLFHFFGSPDRVCHMVMRHADPTHPLYDEAAASREYPLFGRMVKAKDTPLAIYQQMDAIVGWLLDKALQPNDLLLIVSDHGFDSFRREVSLNNWLVDEGFLKLRDTEGGAPLRRENLGSQALAYVDWGATKAYSMAIGKIYLNRQGREGRGVVIEEEAGAVVEEITKRLYEMRDPDTGEPVVAKVYRREEIYSGPYWKESAHNHEGAPELTVDFVPGYRAAWTTTSGGIRLVDKENQDGELQVAGGPFIYDNKSRWSGDHCGVDIAKVQGIFFANRKLAPPPGDDHFDATHLAPTVLAAVGVPLPGDYDRQPLVAR